MGVGEVRDVRLFPREVVSAFGGDSCIPVCNSLRNDGNHSLKWPLRVCVVEEC